MDLAGTDLARGWERLASSIRTATLVALLVLATAVVALGQFDRSWGVVPLHDGDGPSISTIVVVDHATTAGTP